MADKESGLSYQAEYSRRKTAERAEIGPLPAVANPRRKAQGKHDLVFFLQAYFPESTGLSAFSKAHIEFIDDLQNAILHGGRVTRAVFRGFGKTTIGENACLWALLYGHKKYIPLVGGSTKAAAENLRSLKLELQSNDELLADFPEVCFPIRSLDGKVQRCQSQTLDGAPTLMKWTADSMVFPTVKGSPASGACVATSSINSFNRGQKHKTSDGAQHRPDFVFIDDPQTDQSAVSPSQVAKREQILSSAILRSAGHRSSLSAFVAGTVIAPGDLMDRLTNPAISPSWRAKRVPMLASFSDAHDSHWLSTYADIRQTFDRDDPAAQYEAAAKATQFYADNREVMDAGAEAAWLSCYNEEAGEISAIQHAYNILIDDGAQTFYAECQNEPRVEKGDLDQVDAAALCRKQSNTARYVVPEGAKHLTAFVDVQGKCLYYMVVAWSDGFRGCILDYGIFPDQPRRTLRLADVTKPMTSGYGGDLTSAIYDTLEQLFRERLSIAWESESGTEHRLSAAAVDVNWCDSSDAVEAFCRKPQPGYHVICSKGQGISATGTPVSQWPKRKNRVIGAEWCLTNRKHQPRLLQVCTNTWKTQVARMLAAPPLAKGSLSVYNARPADHRELAEQLLSEVPHKVEAGGRTTYQWKAGPGVDNHLLDCLVGCSALASTLGIQSPHLKHTRKTYRAVRYMKT